MKEMRMKTVLLGCTLGMGLAGAAVQAQTPYIQNANSKIWGQSSNHGPFSIEVHDFPFDPQGLGEHGATTNERIVTFCMEANEDLRCYYCEKTEVEFSDAARNGGVGGGNPDMLDERTAYLYTNFVKGTLDDGLMSFSGDVFTYLNGDHGTALSDVFWVIEEEHDISNLDGLGLALLAMADWAVSPGGEWYGRGLGDVYVMNLTAPVTGDPRQDLLVLMPDSPPPANDCCIDGTKISELLLKYTGEDCSATSHSQEPKHVFCDGDPAMEAEVIILAQDKEKPGDPKARVWMYDQVGLNELFTVGAAAGGESRLKANMWIFVYDLDMNPLQTLNFHTSCSQPINNGDVFGSVEIIDCIGDGEPPLENSCCDYGKPSMLLFEYTGEGAEATNHHQDPKKVKVEGDPNMAAEVIVIATDKKNPADKKAKIWFEGVVELDGLVAIDSLNDGKTKLGKETWIFVYDLNGNLLQSAGFHTSCSQPIAQDDQFGSMLLLDCVAEDKGEPGGDGLCGDKGKPATLTLRYTGEDCSATITEQSPDKVYCSGDPDFEDSVIIVATDKENVNDPKAKIFFSGEVALDSTFVMDAATAGETKLKANTFIHIYDLGGNLLSTVGFHTSCSQPLSVSDQYGSILLEDFTLAEDGKKKKGKKH